LLVFEEALARLAAEIALLDQLAQHLGCVATLTLPVAVLHRPIEDVEAAEIEQVEWPHGPVEALLHGDVDVLGAGVAALEEVHGLLRGGEQNAVDDEAPDLLVQHHP